MSDTQEDLIFDSEFNAKFKQKLKLRHHRIAKNCRLTQFTQIKRDLLKDVL